MEYCPSNVDLHKHMQKTRTPFPEENAAIVIKQVLSTCLYCRTLRIDHRDIKDNNILYNSETHQIKLIDFGSATLIENHGYTQMLGAAIFTLHRCWVQPSLPYTDAGCSHLYPTQMLGAAIFTLHRCWVQPSLPYTDAGCSHLYPTQMLGAAIFTLHRCWVQPSLPYTDAGCSHLYPTRVFLCRAILC